jgi:hypothetical protein
MEKFSEVRKRYNAMSEFETVTSMQRTLGISSENERVSISVHGATFFVSHKIFEAGLNAMLDGVFRACVDMGICEDSTGPNFLEE